MMQLDLGYCGCEDPDDYQSGIACRVHSFWVWENIRIGCDCPDHVASSLKSLWRSAA